MWERSLSPFSVCNSLDAIVVRCIVHSIRKEGIYCRYVGNIHTKVTEGLLAEVFASVGALEGCKLIRKEKV